MSSAFLKMAKVIDEELCAGRITVPIAKAQLRTNKPIAYGLQLMYEASNHRDRLKHTKEDWERDKKLDEDFYMRSTW